MVWNVSWCKSEEEHNNHIIKKQAWNFEWIQSSNRQKRYIFKHILLQTIRFFYVQVPLTAQTVELEDMPKRGRLSQKFYKLIWINAKLQPQMIQKMIKSKKLSDNIILFGNTLI